MKFLDLDDIVDTADGDPLAREVTVTITLRSPTPGRIGRVLDEVAEALRRSDPAVQFEMETPGYTSIWYGHEEVSVAYGG